MTETSHQIPALSPIALRGKSSLLRRLVEIRTSGAPVGAIALLLFFCILAIIAPLIVPHDPLVGALSARYRPPAWAANGSMEYILGTDHLGRDILSRLIYGSRVSITVAVIAVVFAGAVGTIVGMISGFLGGLVDQVVMRITDAWLGLPAITLAIFLAAILGPSQLNIIIILASVYWTRYARVVRGEVLSLRERDFVKLARIAGCGQWTIMFRHILPNVINSAVVIASLMVGVVVVAEASLSFLGVGVPPPTPAWGVMLADGKNGLMAGYWWLTVFPGVCIAAMVMAANIIGDWVRVRFDPQQRQL